MHFFIPTYANNKHKRRGIMNHETYSYVNLVMIDSVRIIGGTLQ